jgi:hypothetical protein
VSAREAPLSLLYDITNAQGEVGVVHGIMAVQTVENLLPDGVFNKHFQNEDLLLSELFGLPQIDLPKSVLAITQTELWLFAYLATPIMFLSLLYVYLRLLTWRYVGMIYQLSGHRDLGYCVEILTLIGGAVATATCIENTPAALFVTCRNVVAMLFVVHVLRLSIGRKPNIRVRGLSA